MLGHDGNTVESLRELIAEKNGKVRHSNTELDILVSQSKPLTICSGLSGSNLPQKSCFVSTIREPLGR